MIFEKDHHGIRLKFEDEDTFKLKRLVWVNIESDLKSESTALTDSEVKNGN